jgi:M6 family metalloprotease-like protein
VQADGKPPLAHDAAYYSNLFFGPQNSVADYFKYISNGRFTWTNAGIVGPIRLTQDKIARDLPPRFGLIKQKVGEVFNVASLDANKDGKVDDQELIAVVIDSASENLGAGRLSEPPCVDVPTQLPPPRPQKIQWCGLMTAIGHRASLMMACHELLHRLGLCLVGEMYGTNFLNSGYSTMGASPGGADDRSSWHLDPFHKMKLGWIEPQLVDGYQTNKVVLAGYRFGKADGAVLLFNPNDSDGRSYFLLEYRTNQAGVDYDQNLPTNGVAIWSVDLDKDKNPYTIPPLTPQTDPKLVDFSINLAWSPELPARDGSALEPRGRNTLLGIC